MKKRVVVLPYDPQWPAEFDAIRQELEAVIGDLILGVEHVGSTSVPGLSAKPIIDIDVVIRDYGLFDEVMGRLRSVGYQHEGDLGIRDREAFRYDNKPHLRQHHLYVCPQFSEELHRHITFRDYLRTHPQAVKQYSKVKEEGARLYPESMEDYIQYKSPCIEEMYYLCGLKK